MLHVQAATHVVLDRDWIDYVAIVSGVIASVIGVAALIIALLARRDIALDRRQVFELGVLKEIAESWARSTDCQNDPHMSFLAGLVPELPTLHEWLHDEKARRPIDTVARLEGDAAANKAWDDWDAYRKRTIPRVKSEIDAAIAARTGAARPARTR